MLTTIFYHVDTFCEEYSKQTRPILLKNGTTGKKRGPKPKMLMSEIMTIVILFHHSGFRNFKAFYSNLKSYHRSAFTCLVSYNRFVELQKQVIIPLMLFLSISCSNDSSDIHFIDSTCLKVCHNKRIYSNKTFKNIAQRGKTSVDWFYGFKLHLVINANGEISGFHITPGNVSDCNLHVVKSMTKNMIGKLFGDKGYLSRKLFMDLYQQGLTLITKIKKNMKNKLMDFYDKLLLKKRGVIESVNNVLKNRCMLEHSRHRSVVNFFVNIFATLNAYNFIENKPSIKCVEMPLISNN